MTFSSVVYLTETWLHFSCVRAMFIIESIHANIMKVPLACEFSKYLHSSGVWYLLSGRVWENSASLPSGFSYWFHSNSLSERSDRKCRRTATGLTFLNGATVGQYVFSLSQRESTLRLFRQYNWWFRNVPRLLWSVTGERMYISIAAFC